MVYAPHFAATFVLMHACISPLICLLGCCLDAHAAMHHFVKQAYLAASSGALSVDLAAVSGACSKLLTVECWG